MKGSIQKKIAFASLFVSIVFAIAAACVDNWVKTENGKTGLFWEKLNDQDERHKLACNDDTMTQTECGYLQASQSTGLSAMIAAFVTIFLMIYQMKTNAPATSVITFTSSSLQLMFGIMCLILYSLFKGSYLASDYSVNVEYPKDDFSNYEVGWVLFLLFVLLGSVTTMLLGMDLRTVLKNKNHGKGEPLYAEDRH